MRIEANRKLCSGHARCAATAPDIFTLDDDGYIDFETKTLTSDQAVMARRGVKACPERALTLIEDDVAD
jgi:ferredoxin